MAHYELLNVSCNCKSSLELESGTAKSRTRVPTRKVTAPIRHPDIQWCCRYLQGKVSILTGVSNMVSIRWSVPEGCTSGTYGLRMQVQSELIYRELRQLFLGR